MPAVRSTPKRRRMVCPTCGKDVAFTYPWDIHSGIGRDMRRDYDRRVLSNHNDPSTKSPCPDSGGMGLQFPRTQQTS